MSGTMFPDQKKPSASEMVKITERWNKSVKSVHPFACVRLEDVKAYFEKRYAEPVPEPVKAKRR